MIDKKHVRDIFLQALDNRITEFIENTQIDLTAMDKEETAAVDLLMSTRNRIAIFLGESKHNYSGSKANMKKVQK